MVRMVNLEDDRPETNKIKATNKVVRSYVLGWYSKEMVGPLRVDRKCQNKFCGLHRLSERDVCSVVKETTHERRFMQDNAPSHAARSTKLHTCDRLVSMES